MPGMRSQKKPNDGTRNSRQKYLTGLARKWSQARF